MGRLAERIKSGSECVWNVLERKDRPLVLYGTGNGADKVIDELERRGVSPDGVFASDGFVRDRYFRSMKVESLESASVKFPGMRIAICFASSLESVISNMERIDGLYETYAPDVPVYGGEICTDEWLDRHEEELEETFSLLADEESKRIFESVLRFRYTGKISFLTENESDRKTDFTSVIKAGRVGHYCDLGAYRGDTADEMLGYNPEMKIVALEPDIKTFRKASEHFRGNGNVELYNCAAWKREETLPFSTGGGRQSSVSGAKKTVPVEGRTLDGILGGYKTDFIKFDVEGSEKEALEGCAETISRYRPSLAVSLYHRTEDIFALPLMINRTHPGYRFYIRRYRYIPAWDLNLYCV